MIPAMSVSQNSTIRRALNSYAIAASVRAALWISNREFVWLLVASSWFLVPRCWLLVMCLTNSWCFVAPKMGWGEARRGSISAAICDRGATKPQAIFGATLRAAVLLASRVVARSLQARKGMLVARA